MQKPTKDAEDIFEAWVAEMVYDSTSYFPCIYVPNSMTADYALFPIVAIGTDFGTYDFGDDYNDHIPGILTTINEESVEVVLNEVAAKNAARPVFIIANCSDGVIYNVSSSSELEIGGGSGDGSSAGKQEAVGHPYINEYRITEAYESSGASEYRYRYRQMVSGTVASGAWSESIDNIPNDKIGHLFTDKKCNILAAPLNLTGIYFATFEYDWYTSHKTLCFHNFPGGVFACPDGRKKYVHEWYQFRFIDFSPGNQIPFTEFSKGQIAIKWNP